jgi:hypothetical protein
VLEGAYVDLLSPVFLAGLDMTERAGFWRGALADSAARSAVAEVDGELIGFAHAVAGSTVAVPARGWTLNCPRYTSERHSTAAGPPNSFRHGGRWSTVLPMGR